MIVVKLEVIHVDQQQAERQASPSGATPFVFQHLVKPTSVGQAGELVFPRHALKGQAAQHHGHEVVLHHTGGTPQHKAHQQWQQKHHQPLFLREPSSHTQQRQQGSQGISTLNAWHGRQARHRQHGRHANENQHKGVHG